MSRKLFIGIRLCKMTKISNEVNQIKNLKQGLLSTLNILISAEVQITKSIYNFKKLKKIFLYAGYRLKSYLFCGF